MHLLSELVSVTPPYKDYSNFRANDAGPAQKNPLEFPKGLKNKVLDSKKKILYEAGMRRRRKWIGDFLFKSCSKFVHLHNF